MVFTNPYKGLTSINNQPRIDFVFRSIFEYIEYLFNAITPFTRTINTTYPLMGGGDLSVDRTFYIEQSSPTQSGYITSTNYTNWYTAYNDSIVSASVTGTTTKTLTLNQQDGGTITASWTDIDTAPVTSVFGRTGAIIAQSGDYNTSQVTESTNLYFTNARAIASTLTGYTSGAGTITSSDTILTAIQKLNGNTNALSGVYFPLIGGTVTGTGGNGFIGLLSQGTVPATPSSGFRLYANSSHALSWIGQNGFTRTFDGISNTANRTYTLPNFDGDFLLTSTTPSSGSVLFGTGTTIAQDNTNFFWNNTNKRLGVGTDNPVSKISVIDAISGRGVFLDVNTVSSHSGIWLGANNLIPLVSNYALLSNGTNLFINRPSGGNIGIRENNTEQVTIFSGGNVGIGTSTNLGFRLDVLGHFRVRVGVSPSLAYESGLLYHGTNYWQYPSGNDYIFATRTIAAGNLRFRTNDTDRFVISPIGELSQGSLTTFSNSSGSTNNSVLTISSRINNTGTYSGIFRGIFYNPTLTSLTGTTHRAIETVTGDVIFGSTSGNVAIGTSTINSSAIFQINSTDRGFLPPRMTTIQWDAISTKAQGLEAFDTTQQKPVYVGTTSGINQWVNSTIFTQTNTVTISNTTTETSILGTGIGTKTLTANFLAIGKIVRLTVRGFMNETSTPTIRIRLKLGSTTIFDTTAVTINSLGGTDKYFDATYDITCRTTGVTGTVFPQGRWQYVANSNVNSVINGAVTSTTIIDTTISQVLDLTVEWGTANALNNVVSTTCSIEIIN